MSLMTTVRGAWDRLRAYDDAAMFQRLDESVEQAARRRGAEALAGATPGLPAPLANGSLPVGVHQASAGELVARFGFNDERLALLDELAAAVQTLRGTGVTHLGIGGSFVGPKAVPGDIDALYVHPGGSGARLLPHALRRLDDAGNRVHAEQLDGVVGVASMLPGHRAGENYLEFFAGAKDGSRRGTVLLDLRQRDVANALRDAVAGARAGGS